MLTTINDCAPKRTWLLVGVNNDRISKYLAICEGTKLRMTSLPLATAATLYHRFFHHFNEDNFDPYVCIILLPLHFAMLDYRLIKVSLKYMI